MIEHGGIIAAGDGRRLRDGGYALPKPLIPVAGRPLIGHAVDRLLAVGVGHIEIIVNASAKAAADWLSCEFPDASINIVVRTTASSFESFCDVAERLKGRRAVVTTVDGWFPEGGFDTFVQAAGRLPDGAVGLGVTDFVEDEKPLWVTLAVDGAPVERLGESRGTHVTAGLYALPTSLPGLDPVAFGRLRDYLASLARQRVAVHGIVLPKVLDIDRPQDLRSAQSHAAGTAEVRA